MNVVHCTEVRFASSLSGGFITAIVVNPPEKNLAKCISVHCTDRDSFMKDLFTTTLLLKEGHLQSAQENMIYDSVIRYEKKKDEKSA